MAKRSLLDLVQTTLIHISSDLVNDWDETDESRDVGYIVRDAYFDIVEGQNWPHLRNLANLTSVSDTNNPTQLSLDDDFQRIDNESIYYDVRESATDDPTYKQIIFCEPDEFLRIVLPRSSNASDSNVVTTTDPVALYIFNDRGPTYCTSFDDETLIFDSYNVAVDTTLQGSKSRVVAYSEPTFTLNNTFIPDLPSKDFGFLIAEVKSRAMMSIAQEVDPKQETIAQNYRDRAEVKKWRTKDGIRKADYGRQRANRRSWRSRGTT